MEENDVETIGSEVFECSDVHVFKIPPGELSMAEWQKYEQNTVWHGNLRIVEEEIIVDDVDDIEDGGDEGDEEGMNMKGVSDDKRRPELRPPLLPVDRIRLKVELFNHVPSPSGGQKKTEHLWALVWYNPIYETHVLEGGNLTNREETIQRTESYRLFKIIAQIPGTQYVGSQSNDENNKGLKVALGLKFGDKIDAYTFIERLTSYKKLFNSFVDQYNYEIDMINLTKQLTSLSLTENSFLSNSDSLEDHCRLGSFINKDGDNFESNNSNDNANKNKNNNNNNNDDDDDDDFGDFVG